jgi:pteridine reductase
MNNPTLLVTGSARRVGRTITQHFHQRGFDTLVHYHQSENEAQALIQQLNRERPGSAKGIQADLQQMASVDSICAAVAQQGRLDALVHNASCFFATPIGECREDDWQQLIDTHMKLPFFISQALLPWLQKSRGSITAITDFHAQRPLQNYPIYNIAKAGLAAMVKTLAQELGPKVRVNAVAPGNTLWPEGDNGLTDAKKQRYIERTALKTQVAPAEIAEAVWYFHHAQHVTGQSLGVDAGRA